MFTTNLKKEIKTIKHALKDEGIIYIEVPGIKNISRAYGSDILLYLQNAHTYNFTLKTLENIFKKYGFKKIYGDERIRAIFKKDKFNEGNEERYDSDYTETVNLIQKLEKRVNNGFFKRLYNINNSMKKLLKGDF